MPTDSIDVKVRPLANASLEKASLQGAARLYINKDSLIALTGSIENGKACFIEKLGADDGPTVKREALLWILTDKNVSPNVAMMSRAFQDASGFKIGDQARISLADEPTPDASEVVVRDSTEDGSPLTLLPGWQCAVATALERAEHVFPGMTLEGVSLGKLRRTFKVTSVNSQGHSLARFVLDDTASAVRILHAGEDDAALSGQGSAGNAPGGHLVLQNVPGLTRQTELINNYLDAFTRPFVLPTERKSCGLVIHGGRGTGKTFILQRLADTKWGRVHWIKPSDKLTSIRETFKQAKVQQPCMVLIDDLEQLIPQDRTNRDAVIDAIGEEMDSLSATAQANGGLPQVIILATCSDYMTDVPYKLQKRTRFHKNVTLPIPRAPERLEILRYYDPPLPPNDKEACLADIAQKTHAYNANDLASLVDTAIETRATKIRKEQADIKEILESGTNHLTLEDMEHALRVTRPTAMHDINLQPPTIHWEDVGGQENVKRVLLRMIKYAKETDPSVPRVIRNPPMGLLLYGPPGCSKTLSAQAMATESSFNFFSVKGAELLNMYVGESERAVRNLFERARAAAPSIIFFDEIDAIGGQRPSGSGASASRGGGGSVNTVTTLLTEMDGFEALSGVIVIAATNRPEAIDPALLRAGRFDKVVYVGPPDLAAREAVLRVHLRGQPLASDVNLSDLAVRAEGHSGAEIQHVCNEAALAVQERYDDDETGTARLEFTMADLTEALDREPRAITSQMLEGYTRWAQLFGKK